MPYLPMHSVNLPLRIASPILIYRRTVTCGVGVEVGVEGNATTNNLLAGGSLAR